MTRPKGTPNKKVATVKYTTESGTHEEPITEKDIFPIDIKIPPSWNSHKDILLSIVDALYDKDGDAGTWKPIRDKIEAL